MIDDELNGMEVKFDKEIDALLRQVAKAEQSAFARGTSVPHLDADEISAFSENALPEKARRRCTAHLADCGLCRSNLSNLIALNAEARTDTGGQELAAGIAVPAVPWYQRIFSGSNLAYAMGALVLAVAGITFFTIWQDRSGYETAKLDSSNSLSEGKPANPSLQAANMSAPSNSSPASANADELPDPSKAPDITIGGDVTTERKSQEEAEPIGEPRRDEPFDLKSAPGSRSGSDEITDVARANEVATVGEKENKQEANLSAGETAPPAKPVPGAAEGQTKTAEKKREKLKTRSEDDVDKDDRAGAGKLQSGRQINGKTFTLANGVWYDSAYANQPTTNVRRATPEYRALDQGLRSIAENLGGTVVVVWNRKAYRIQ